MRFRLQATPDFATSRVEVKGEVIARHWYRHAYVEERDGLNRVRSSIESDKKEYCLIVIESEIIYEK